MNPKVDKFLEEHNITYLFLLLANLEVERLGNLPYTMKKQLKGKLTNIALEHVAENNIPDYVMSEAMDQSDNEPADK